jgi:outer membrane protein OmpA-like peptidoglycan-associated protein
LIEIFVLDANGNRVSKAKQKSPSLYNFNTLSQAQYAAMSSEVKNEAYEIFGQIFFKHPGDFKDSITISAKSTQGLIAEKVTTKANGFFKFTDLQPNEKYSFSLSKEYKRELYVYFFDKNNSVIDSLLFADFSKYVFEKLKADEASRLALLDEDYGMTQFSADLVAGQIFKKLPGDYKQGIKVFAYDDDGNVLDSAYTDSKGNFEFKQLKRDERFTLKIADEADGELNIAFMNFNGHFEGAITTNTLNEYIYSKIVLEAAAELGLEDFKDGKYEPLYGQLFKRLPGDYTSGTKIYAYDEDGNIVDIAIIDSQGNFKFTKLERDENYLFRTDNQDGEFNISILDAEGELVDRISVKDKTWVYTQLKREENALSKIKEQADGGIDITKYTTPERKVLTSNQQTIYYNYKNYKLSEVDIEILDGYVSKLKENSRLVFDIQSHTDPSERTSQRSYSALRSVSIANYIHDQGIGLEQIEITNWEEQKLAVECPADSACGEELRLKNMRTEIALIDLNVLPRNPDYSVYYGFDQWTLSEDGNKQMFEVLKAKELDSSKRIYLDGYTDVWGGYEMNERISELRVQNVKNILIREGHDPMTINATIHGESKPIGPCKLQYPCSIKDRQQNRRVEVRIEP